MYLALPRVGKNGIKSRLVESCGSSILQLKSYDLH